MKDELLALAERLWKECEIRRLSSPWTTPTRFDDNRDYWIEQARSKAKDHSGGGE